jgi:putative DNA primase/helicase
VSAPQIARWAERYCEIGLALTWTPFGQKGPRHAGWMIPGNAITEPKRAFAYWHVHPGHGIAALLAASGLVSVDVDDEQYSPQVLQHFGIDLEQLRESNPTIVGRHYRLMFRAPDVELKHRSAIWPKEQSPGSFVLFELRAGNIADTLPPSRHAVTGCSYRWENPPKYGFPPLPNRLLEIWLDWENTNREIRSLCPWWSPPSHRPPPARAERNDSGESVIAQFNASHDAALILENYGYRRHGKRFAPPETDHDAGIVLLDSGKIFCFHASDVLHGQHALDAFDCYRILAHGGDYRAAVKAAAQVLGIGRERTA